MKTVFYIILIVLLLNACDNNRDMASKAEISTKAASATTASSVTYAPVSTWIDDFRNFRTAVLNEDESKVETYFSFPIRTDSADIWLAVLDDDAALIKAQNTHQPFTEKDFKQYYSKLFNADFVHALLKIKSAHLFKSGAAETQLFKTEDFGYQLYATYDKEKQLLTMNLAYTGGKDEDGNYRSEGEHNINFLFTIKDDRYLHFKGLFLAG